MKASCHSDQPITGFVLFPVGTLLLRRGYGDAPFLGEDMTELSSDDFKHLLWLFELALLLPYNSLARIEPNSLPATLMAIGACCRQKQTDPQTGAVLRFTLPDPICTEHNEQPSGGGLCQSVARVLPQPPLCAGTHPPRLGRLGGLAEAGAPAVA